MPTKRQRQLHSDGSCTQHTMMGCPRSCWVIGRTVILKYQGKISVARTYDTPEIATARIAYENDWTAKQIAKYEAKGLPVPQQYTAWVKVIWDGTNHR
jgi:hypothetical protein